MGQLVSVNKYIHSFRVGLGDDAPSSGLSSRGDGALIPNLPNHDLGDLDAPPASIKARCRPVLERLLKSLNPAAASRNADALLREFGSLNALLNAAPEEIDRSLGYSVPAGAVILAARDLMREALCQQVRGSPVRSNDIALHRYLQSMLGGLREERLHVVFADREGRYIADEQMSSGGVEVVGLNFRDVVRRVIALEAVAILLAHNHPSGIATPSSSDINATREVASAAGQLGIHLIDHLIITPRTIFSILHEREV